eukprot:TRINITY_DN28268_c0_g1_i1.p1 TRINITY_DN28268_c0_g1~~TRINITY_DN28268_c0_g1_i1.p1  ORF type:complete len:859 (-),score=83.38 TRINITY_DN28268_c0_g1_i1:24-2306(-)
MRSTLGFYSNRPSWRSQSLKPQRTFDFKDCVVSVGSQRRGVQIIEPDAVLEFRSEFDERVDAKWVSWLSYWCKRKLNPFVKYRQAVEALTQALSDFQPDARTILAAINDAKDVIPSHHPLLVSAMKEAMSLAMEERFAQAEIDYTRQLHNRSQSKQVLGSYTTDVIKEKTCDPTLFAVIQYDLHKIMRLQALAPDYAAVKFPPDFSKQIVQKRTLQNVAFAGLAAVNYMNIDIVRGFASTISVTTNSLYQCISGLADIASCGLLMTSYDEYFASMREYLNLLENDNELLVKGGGHVTSGYWEDVQLGMLSELLPELRDKYVKLVNRVPALRSATRFRQSAAALFSGDVYTADFGTNSIVVPAGALLKIKGSQRASGHVALQVEWRSPNASAALVSGWVMKKLVLKECAYKHVKKRGKAIFENASAFSKVVGYIGESETIVVIEKALASHPSPWLWHDHELSEAAEMWKLDDGRGWVLADLDAYEGPLTDFDNEVHLKVGLPSKITATNALSLANAEYSSTTGIAARLGAAFALWVGGFFTHGITWAISAVWSGANSVGEGALFFQHTYAIRELVAHFLSRLAAWEMHMFVPRTLAQEAFAESNANRKVCDVVAAAQNGKSPCDSSEFCMRSGVFFERSCMKPTITGCTRQGVCVPAVRPQMPPCYLCSHDQDCVTGVCILREVGSRDVTDPKKLTEALVKDMAGLCHVPCEPGRAGCKQVPSRDFGVQSCDASHTTYGYFGRSMGFSEEAVSRVERTLGK